MLNESALVGYYSVVRLVLLPPLARASGRLIGASALPEITEKLAVQKEDEGLRLQAQLDRLLSTIFKQDNCTVQLRETHFRKVH